MKFKEAQYKCDICQHVTEIRHEYIFKDKYDSSYHSPSFEYDVCKSCMGSLLKEKILDKIRKICLRGG